MQLAMPEMSDVKAARDLHDKLCVYGFTLDISTPASTKSRFIELMPVFKLFAESIEILMSRKMNYDSVMAYFLAHGVYKLEHGVIVWHAEAELTDAKQQTEDHMYHIDSLRSEICDAACVIMTITDK